jgi:septal ring factor EnvC (AmiA/AmiB activator)
MKKLSLLLCALLVAQTAVEADSGSIVDNGLINMGNNHKPVDYEAHEDARDRRKERREKKRVRKEIAKLDKQIKNLKTENNKTRKKLVKARRKNQNQEEMAFLQENITLNGTEMTRLSFLKEGLKKTSMY